MVLTGRLVATQSGRFQYMSCNDTGALTGSLYNEDLKKFSVSFDVEEYILSHIIHN